MKHPFGCITPLPESQLKNVSGGTPRAQYVVELPGDTLPREKQRPDIGSTMAIGEEGGFRFPIM